MYPVAPTGGGAPASAMGFHTTHWTMVLAAREQDGTEAREALASLCSTYWHPLYAFVRRQGHQPPDAEDLTQEFFARLLSKKGSPRFDRAELATKCGVSVIR